MKKKKKYPRGLEAIVEKYCRNCARDRKQLRYYDSARQFADNNCSCHIRWQTDCKTVIIPLLSILPAISTVPG